MDAQDKNVNCDIKNIKHGGGMKKWSARKCANLSCYGLQSVINISCYV